MAGARAYPILIAAMLGVSSAWAGEVKVEAYADLRLVHAPDERAWEDGGLGKTRFGPGDDGMKLAEIVAEVTWEIAPGLTAFAAGRYEEDQCTPVDVMEAYLAYAPEAAGPFRWSAKLGAFFPPVSLENDQIGWASTWTITPSAINSWVGEELRTIGLEGRVEWRGRSDVIAVYGAVFGLNDPAGILIADRGWALTDRWTGLFDKVRVPDAYAVRAGAPIPLTTPIFKEIDDRAGWYAGASWTHPGWGRITVLRYDNEGDPAVYRGPDIAWRTAFWSGGIETRALGFIIKAQGLTGETQFTPSPVFDSVTEFSSAYLMIARVFGPVRAAVRGEVFHTRQTMTRSGAVSTGRASENGHAFTAGVFWTPKEWLQIGAEALYVTSERPQRSVLGGDPTESDTQLQTSVKLIY